jgi:transposase
MCCSNKGNSLQDKENMVMTTPYQLSAGIDIAAKSFTATWGTHPDRAPKALTFEQSPTGYQRFQDALTQSGAQPNTTLIVMEATGNYWVRLAVTLHQAGYVVSILNPAQVLHFARSLPRRSKTDQLDAHLLLRFAIERQPAAWTPPEQVYHDLRQRLLVRDGLLQMRTQARNQRHALQQWPVKVEAALASIESVIGELDTQLNGLEKEISQILRDGAWASSALLLLSTPGLGLVTTAWLLVTTLNFSLAYSPDQLSAYAGLVPLERQSGTSVRGRASIGHAGNARLRTALYMATLSAARANPTIQAFYQRLRAAGKPMKVARCAAARKLLHLAYAIVTKQQPYRSPQEQCQEQEA